MKILQVSPTWWPATRYGGTIVSVRALSSSLASLGEDVHVATTNVDGAGQTAVPLDRAWNDQGVQVHSFASHWGRRTYYSPSMQKFFRQRMASFDVAHTHSVFLWPTWAAAQSARAQQRSYVLSPRGMLVPELIRARSQLAKKIWLRWFERSNLRHAAAIHVTSSVERDDLLRMDFGPLPRIEVIPNGVDLPELPTKVRKPAQILFVGRLSWKKGLQPLIDALALMPTITLLLAGPDNEGLAAALKARAHALGVLERVQFLGEVNALERNRLLAESSLLVLPSLSENFGNSVAEAMAMACPVVVTQGVGIAEHVTRADCGTVVLAEPTALADAITAIIDHPQRAAGMGARGRAYVEAELSWSAVAKRMHALYQHILHEPARA